MERGHGRFASAQHHHSLAGGKIVPHVKLAHEQLSIVERALELARSGYFANATDIRKQLKQEGYIQSLVDEHLRGLGIKRKIKSLCKERRRGER